MTETTETIETLGLIEYDVSFAAISKMKTDFAGLTIAGIEDKEGYQKVHECRMVVKNHRTAVEKKRKELKADALKYGRMVDAKAKGITEKLLEIELPLETEEKRIDAEIEAIKQAKIEKEKARVENLDKAIDEIIALGREGVGLSSQEIEKLLTQTREISLLEDFYQEFLPRARREQENSIAALQLALSEAKKREEEAQRQAEEKAELEKLRKEQEEKEKELKAEQEKLEAERKTEEEKIAREKKALLDQRMDLRRLHFDRIGVVPEGGFFVGGKVRVSAEEIYNANDAEFETILDVFKDAIATQVELEKEAKTTAGVDRKASGVSEAHKKSLDDDIKVFLDYLQMLKEVEEPVMINGPMILVYQDFQAVFLHFLNECQIEATNLQTESSVRRNHDQ